MKKRIIIHPIVCSAIALFFIISCKKDNPVPPINYEYNYFPNNKGHYVIYNVDSIVLNKFNYTTTTYKYQLKEIIDSFYLDNSGRSTQRIVRYKRQYDSVHHDTTSWVLEKVWSGNLTATTAERIEDNIRYVKLTFPLKLNATWNGNAYNTIGDWEYQYTTLDAPLTLNNVPFDSTLTVLQINNQNLIVYQLYQEQYARNVGLIYKQIIDETADTLFHPYNNGVIYTQTYVSSGN